MDLTFFSLDAKSQAPIFRQMAEQLKEAIESLALRPGQLLPSTRELASRLSVSRTTVVRCYEELLSQGYLEAVDGVGTFVSNKSSRHFEPLRQMPLPISSYARELYATDPKKLFAHDWDELNYGCSPSDRLPLKQWRQLLLKHSRQLELEKLDYNRDPFGFAPLRGALCQYLSRSRSVRAGVEQMIVFPASLYALFLVTQMLVDRDASVAMAEPGFPYARHTLLSQGARVELVAVDENGLKVEELFRIRPTPAFVYVNPSHHQPSGAMLSVKRRNELLDWADDNKVVIIEDDLDSNFRYSGSAAPSLIGLAQGENVVYIGSLWQSLYPLVNVGYLVIPHKLIDLFSHAWHVLHHAFHTQIPQLDQLALIDLLDEGHLERHLRKSDQIFAARMRTMIHKLSVCFSGMLEIYPASSGMHVTVRFLDRSPVEIRECALEAGLPLVSTALHYSREPLAGEFIVPFAHLTEEEIGMKVEALADLMRGPV